MNNLEIKKTVKKTSEKEIILKEWPCGRWEERTYEYFMSKRVLVKYEDSDEILAEFKFEVWGGKVIQIYSSNRRGWWEKKIEYCGDIPICTEYRCENHSWKRSYIYLLGGAYQTSYEKLDLHGNVIDYSQSRYKIVKDEVMMIFNNNREGCWNTDYDLTEDGRIIELINN